MKLILLFLAGHWIIPKSRAALGDDAAMEDVLIKELNNRNFFTHVDDARFVPWMVLAYNSISPDAERVMKEFKMAAQSLRVIYKFGYIKSEKNSTILQILSSVYSQGVTLFIFGTDKQNPRIFPARGFTWTARQFLFTGLEVLRAEVSWRMDGYTHRQSNKLKYLVLLTNENFEYATSLQNVHGVYSPWLIWFFHPDDMISPALSNILKRALAQLHPRIRMGMVSMKDYPQVAQKFFKTMFTPTIMYLGKLLLTESTLNPTMSMSQTPTVGSICSFALSNRQRDLASYPEDGASALTFGDLPYHKAKLFTFGLSNTTFHFFTRV